MARAAANTQSTNRFRTLTLDDLADFAEALPPRAPIGQGEMVAVADVVLPEPADFRAKKVSVQESADCHTRMPSSVESMQGKLF